MSALPSPIDRPLLDIPEAGRLLGMSRATAYRAAANGALPTIQLAPRRRKVPTALLLAKLGLPSGGAA